MTNQEAREILIGLDAAYRNLPSRLTNDSRQLVNKRIEAIGVAISALEKQDVPGTNVGGTISRQAAIDVLDVLCQEHRYRIPGKAETYSPYNEGWQDALGRAENAIGNLPPVQPERKRGHWEIYVISMFDGEGCKCSECGFEGMPHWVSCPNCDARMEGVKNETD